MLTQQFCPELMVANLSLTSTLRDLTLHRCQIEVDQCGRDIVHVFEHDSVLPGVILIEQEHFVGMISRRRFLEHMSRPFSLELFLKRPVKLLIGFAGTDHLVLSGDTPVVTAAQQALERSPELLNEPIIVQVDSQDYCLLDVHHLLVAQSQIHELTTKLLHQQTQSQLIQTEKMASLGRMVAGVAHEILNPINFIAGNISHLANYSQDLMDLVALYEQRSPNIEPFKTEIELEFLLKDLPQLLDSMQLGSERLKKIVNGLKTFSHMDEVTRKPADLHACIDNTLLILNSRLKNSVQVVKHYGNLPLVNCYAGQLSQVLMNLIANAIDALEEHRTPHPTIHISTEVSDARWAQIQITDNGPGIPPEIQGRIFETFFTTKPVGKGTGLGLAISHQIIVDKHQGQIRLLSEPGQGTTFEISLPLS